MYPTGQQQYDDQRRAKHLDGLEKRDDAASVGAIRERAAGQGRAQIGAFMANKSSPIRNAEAPRLSNSQGSAICCAQLPIFDNSVASQKVPNRRVASSLSDEEIPDPRSPPCPPRAPQEATTQGGEDIMLREGEWRARGRARQSEELRAGAARLDRPQ